MLSEGPKIPSRMMKSDFYAELSVYAGTEFLIREFFQNYLLSQKLPCLLGNISPKLSEFPKSTAGKVSSVVLMACLTSFIYDYTYRSRTKICQITNDLILNLFTAALYQQTKSILPNIALRIAHYELLFTSP